MHVPPFSAPTTQDFILAGVLLHLVAALIKTLVKTPKQQAQIDAIEGKVDVVIAQVQAALPTAQTVSQKGVSS